MAEEAQDNSKEEYVSAGSGPYMGLCVSFLAEGGRTGAPDDGVGQLGQCKEDSDPVAHHEQNGPERSGSEEGLAIARLEEQ